MRILGIDYGTKRIGVAVSDESMTIATPLCVVDNRKNLREQFTPLIAEYNIRKVVIGLPLDFNGDPGPLANKVKNLAALLKNWFDVETFLQDERYTSLQADAAARKSGTPENKSKRDMAAATIILRTFLDGLHRSAAD